MVRTQCREKGDGLDISNKRVDQVEDKCPVTVVQRFFIFPEILESDLLRRHNPQQVVRYGFKTLIKAGNRFCIPAELGKRVSLAGQRPVKTGGSIRRAMDLPAGVPFLVPYGRKVLVDNTFPKK